MTMDWSKVSRSTWIVTGGTVAAVIGTLLLAWYSFSLGPLSIDVSAWDTGVVGKLAVLGSLVMLAGVVLLFLPNPPELPLPLPMLLLAASGFTALMAVFKFIDHHSNTSTGLWLTVIGGIVAAYGAYEMGGRINIPTTTSQS